MENGVMHPSGLRPILGIATEQAETPTESNDSRPLALRRAPRNLGPAGVCLGSVHMHVTLRKGNRDPFGVERLFDHPCEVPIDAPIVRGLRPRTTDKVDGRVRQFMNAYDWSRIF